MAKEERHEALYDLMVQTGYPAEFVDLVARQMNTEYTSQRMLAFVRRAGLVRPEQFADEMLAILAERDRLREKHLAAYAQEQVNRLYQQGLEED